MTWRRRTCRGGQAHHLPPLSLPLPAERQAVARSVAGLEHSSLCAWAGDSATRRTVIPNGGTFLGCNSVGYSLASYPAGNGTTATCDVTYTTDIPDNAGIALFNTSVAADFVLANRMDA